MTDESAKEMARTILKNELEASEMMVELGTEYSIEEVNQAFSEVVNETVSKVEDKEREASIYQLVYVLGEQLGSESMAKEGAKKYNELQATDDRD